VVTTERLLPSRRENCTQVVQIGPSKVYVTLGFYDAAHQDVGEIFISLEKTGSERRSMMDEIARLASKLRQHGCPLQMIAEGWLGTKGQPAGPVRGSTHIKHCSSVLDYVARLLLITYCQRDDLAHVAAPEHGEA